MESVDAPVGEAAGNGPRDSSQPFLYKATCIGSMEVALLFQYLIIMNLFSGILVFCLFLNQTVTTLLPRVFPALLKLSGVTALSSVPNVIISRSLVSGGNYFSAPFIPPASILIFNCSPFLWV